MGAPAAATAHVPDVVSADRENDSTRCVRRWLGIAPKTVRRNTSHGSVVGRVRWVVERTLSWLKGLRRMSVRYDRPRVILDAFTTLAASSTCSRLPHPRRRSRGVGPPAP